MTLSDKQANCGGKGYDIIVYSEKDVKEFIKQLKKEITPKSPTKEFQEECIWSAIDLITLIDKLAGDKLI